MWGGSWVLGAGRRRNTQRQLPMIGTADKDINIILRDADLPQTDVVDAVLPFSSSVVTTQELIAERVRAECDKRLPDRMASRLLRLDALNEAEQAEFQAQLSTAVENVDLQIERALEAFETNGFLLLVDETQVTDLDEEVHLGSGSVVTFVQLTPLVGG